MDAADKALAEGFLEGDTASLRQVDSWVLQVLRHRRLNLGQDVEDTAQEVRRKLVASLSAGRYQGTASLRTYVWRVAEHAAIDRLRARRHAPDPISLERTSDPPSAIPSAECQLLLKERRKVFERVLARLDEGCRDLFRLIAFDELSYADIARRLGTTEGAVKVRALRCREKAAEHYRSVTSAAAVRPSSV